MKTGVNLALVLMMLTLTSCNTAMLVKTGRMTVMMQDQDHMASTIGKALIDRRWSVSKEEPGTIYAKLFVRSHMAEIKIEYDDKSFDIQYVNSSNLKYKKKPDGAEYIHRHYNSWIQNLTNDIYAYSGQEE